MHDSDLNFLSVADGQPAIGRGSDLLSTDSVPDALPQDPISKMEPMPATPAFILERDKLSLDHKDEIPNVAKQGGVQMESDEPPFDSPVSNGHSVVVNYNPFLTGLQEEQMKQILELEHVQGVASSESLPRFTEKAENEATMEAANRSEAEENTEPAGIETTEGLLLKAMEAAMPHDPKDGSSGPPSGLAKKEKRMLVSLFTWKALSTSCGVHMMCTSMPRSLSYLSFLSLSSASKEMLQLPLSPTIQRKLNTWLMERQVLKKFSVLYHMTLVSMIPG
jgi:hypothetical protein